MTAWDVFSPLCLLPDSGFFELLTLPGRLFPSFRYGITFPIASSGAVGHSCSPFRNIVGDGNGASPLRMLPRMMGLSSTPHMADSAAGSVGKRRFFKHASIHGSVHRYIAKDRLMMFQLQGIGNFFRRPVRPKEKLPNRREQLLVLKAFVRPARLTAAHVLFLRSNRYIRAVYRISV